MTENNSLRPIGVFDSGVGGISVLGKMIKEMPNEEFIYLADTANAPYGTKNYDRVLELSVKAAETLLNKNIKTLVVACNTATSVAINTIRGMTDIPVIGMEPALKPAVESGIKGIIVVLATPLTLKERKFNNLLRRFDKDTPIVPIPCPGLVELIESEAETEKIKSYFLDLLKPVPASQISAVVLGCTHYCFVRKEIIEVTGGNVKIYDGNEGTVRHLKFILESQSLVSPKLSRGIEERVRFISSASDKSLEMFHKFLKKSFNSL